MMSVANWAKIAVNSTHADGYLTKTPRNISRYLFVCISLHQRWLLLLMEKILHQLSLLVYPITYKVLYIPDGEPDFFHRQYDNLVIPAFALKRFHQVSTG